MAISKVVVVDGNNLTVRIDRGVAGRGITDVEPVEIDNQLYLEFTFSDGTTETVGPVGTIQYIGESPIVIDGPTISLTTVPVTLGGTNATTAAGARTNLNAANQDTTISAGTGLSGGGSLAANRTISIANTAVTAGSYGAASKTLTATVNAQGQLTALADTPIAIANTQISGLGTMSTQNANAVAITGGSITGITDLAIADGGTGASTAADARTNLGLGTAAVLNAGVANGVATLDAGGTVPLSQIPASIQGGVSYQGSWNAATNTPTIVSSVGTKGHYYVVSVAGSTNINGITDWLPGDWIIFNGSVWEQIDNTDTVQSVNGYVGAVVLNAADVGAPPTTRTITAGTGLSGGGDLSANRTIDIANTAVTAGSYGTASSVPSITVNAQGQLTAASNTTIAIANTQVSGLGTMSTQNANSVAITGGAIDGTAIGGTTAAAVSATTLTTSSTVTLNGGTANGVAYLNGSKVLTTGSALTFDGTDVRMPNGGSILIGASASGASLIAINGTASAQRIVLGTSGTDGVINVTRTSGTTPNLIFQQESAELMRLTSTGLGIGTSSPSAKLNVVGSGDMSGIFETTGTSNAASLIVRSGNGTTSGLYAYARFVNNDTNAQDWRIGTYGNNNLSIVNAKAGTTPVVLDTSGNLGIGTSSFTWLASGSETGVNIKSSGGNTAGINVSSSNANNTRMEMFAAYTINQGGFYLKGDSAYPNMVFGQVSGSTYRDSMILDSSGNLGLGVTPSAWNTVSGVIEAGAYSLSGYSTDYVYFSQNAYYAGGWKYKVSNYATQYEQSLGVHKWFTAPSGTTGNAISFSQVMTLDASGNLGIGTTSPLAKLHVKGATNGNLLVRGGASAASGLTGTALSSINDAASATVSLNFEGSDFNFVQNNAVTATLNSSGNLGLGVTPSASGTTYGGSQMRTFTVESANVVSAAGYDAHFAQNAYRLVDGTWRYQGNGGNNVAHLYSQATGGAHQWFIAPNGAAGDAISFTQAMTLGPAAALRVGVTSDLQGFNFQAANTVGFSVHNSGSSATAAYFSAANNVTLTSAGNFAVINGADGILFGQGATERMRLDSSGNLLVGTTSGAAKVNVNNVGNGGVYVTQSSVGAFSFVSNAIPLGAVGYHMQFLESGAVLGSITSNGLVTAYNTTSDYRLKTVIGPVANAGQRIDALQPVEYTWNSDGSRTRGFLAHQFQEVYADSVTGSKDAVDAEGKPVYQSMQASTPEVIADLVAEIQSLRQRLAAAGI